MTTDEKARSWLIVLTVIALILFAIVVYLRWFAGPYITADAARATFGAEQFYLQLTAMAVEAK
jgi:hypothetical protein